MMRVLIVIFLVAAGLLAVRSEERVTRHASADGRNGATAAVETPRGAGAQGAVSTLWAHARVRSRLENGEDAIRMRDRGLLAMTQAGGTKTELFETRRFARAMLAIPASAAWGWSGERACVLAAALRSVAEVRLATGRLSDP